MRALVYRPSLSTADLYRFHQHGRRVLRDAPEHASRRTPRIPHRFAHGALRHGAVWSAVEFPGQRGAAGGGVSFDATRRLNFQRPFSRTSVSS